MFLKNRNTISKIRRSKVTDYAVLSTSNINYPTFFFKAKGILLWPPSIHPPKPLDEIQQIFVCELLT